MGTYKSVLFLDALKDLTFTYATKAGFSICIDDLVVPPEKDKLIEEANNRVRELTSIIEKVH